MSDMVKLSNLLLSQQSNGCFNSQSTDVHCSTHCSTTSMTLSNKLNHITLCVSINPQMNVKVVFAIFATDNEYGSLGCPNAIVQMSIKI